MEAQKKNRFLVFSAYRAVLFGGLFGVLLFIGIFGSTLWRFYLGTGYVFHYDAGKLAVHYLDVGQGDCTVVQLPDGRVIVMDSGEEMYYPRVKNYLDKRVVGSDGRIDFLIATHSHSDHVGGFVNMLRDFDVGVVYRPFNESINDPDAEGAIGPVADTEIYDTFINSAYVYADEVRFIVAGEEISDAGGRYSWIFHTPEVEFVEVLKFGRFDDYNDISPIVTLVYLNHLFVFTGDAGSRAERQFLAVAEASVLLGDDTGLGGLDFEGKIVYLKAGHHGSGTSSTDDFLKFIDPDKVVISLGARNVYGFPHEQVLYRLAGVGVERQDVMLTGELGNIALVVDDVGDKIYFAFDNEADLRFFWILGVVAVFVVCFVDFRWRVKGEEVGWFK